MKHNKSNTVFLHEIVILHEFLDHLREKQYTQHSIITRTVQIDFLSMGIHLLSNPS